jgi:flagellar protein FliO/FliZ
MKFIRSGRLKDKVVEISTKGLLIAFSALFFLWMISGARAAAPEIRDISSLETETGFTVEFVTSAPLKKEDLAIEFQRNFIQVSFRGVSAFPAKTVKLKHSPLEKAFTYQYQPDLARARILLSTQAKNLEKNSSLEIIDGKVRVNIVKSASTAAAAIQQKTDKVSQKSASAFKAEEDPAELKAREEIIKAADTAGTTVSTNTSSDKPAPKVESENLPIFTAQSAAAQEKKESSSTSSKILASLLLVIGIFGAGTLAVRRFVQGKGLPFQRQNRVIETISTQSLGPKKSVTIVKVLDRTLVLGVTGENINLLVDMGTNVSLDKYLDDSPAGASFSDALSSTLKGPVTSAFESLKPSEAAQSGFRAAMKKRLEGLKPL